MTDLTLPGGDAAARVAADFLPRRPAAILGQKSDAIGYAPPPRTLRCLAAQVNRRRARLPTLAGHGWRDVVISWLLMVLVLAAVFGWYAAQAPDVDAQAYQVPSYLDVRAPRN